MLNRLVESLSETVDRRSFMRQLAGFGATVGFIFFGAEIASATFPIHGCDLCFDPSSCTWANCVSTWPWIANDGAGCTYSCQECYSSSTNNGTCTNAICSRAVLIGCDSGEGDPPPRCFPGPPAKNCP
jgi:hypothetical protein